MIDQRTVEAIEASDTDDLLRIVDGFCANSDWERLSEIRVRCQEALTRGKQLWGVDEHIRYRFALEAPPEWAGPALNEGRGRFSLGPLPEVAASTKTWAEMAPHLDYGPPRMTFAAERIVRGEKVDEKVDLPELQDWEPEYALPTYKSDRLETPAPTIPALKTVDLPEDFKVVDDPESEHALNDLVEPWISQSSGRSQTVTVEGNSLAAIAALGVRTAHHVEISADQAMAHMAWAAGSGGAHGDRRGAAAGRYLTWWAIAALADLDWPAGADEVAAAIQRLRWFWFDDGSPDIGWALRVAIQDEESGLAWAISAGDMAD